MVDFLSGSATFGFLLVSLFFLRFWRTTGDRLFAWFATAFALFACNQIASFLLDASDERTGYVYVLRVLGYCMILFAIVDKNALPPRR